MLNQEKKSRCDRQSSKKLNGGGVLLLTPIIFAPELREELNLFDKEKSESVWVECKSNFNVVKKN